MRRVIAIAGALVLVLAAAGTSHAVLLSDLLNGGSITAGDKLFDNWTLMYYDTSDPTRSFNAANINVAGLIDGGLSPGPGLLFRVSNDELRMTGTGIYDYIDLQFGFRVSVLDPQLNITDGSLGPFTAGWGIDPQQDYDAGWYILETLGTGLGLSDLGAMDAQMSALGPPQSIIDKTNDSTSFLAQNEIWVTNNILVWSSFANGYASIETFTERFSQSPIGVPEPGMLGLLALGGIALLRFKRG